MKKLITILLLAVVVTSCQKSVTDNQQQVVTNNSQPTAEITATKKVFSGSNPSVKIDYKLTNTANVKVIRLNNVLDVVVKDGSNFMYDHQAGGNWYAHYWFVFDMKDGTQLSTISKIYYF